MTKSKRGQNKGRREQDPLRGIFALCGLGIEDYEEAMARGNTGIDGNSTAWFLLRLRNDALTRLMARGRNEGVEENPGEKRHEFTTPDGMTHIWTREFESGGVQDILLVDILRATNLERDVVYMGKGRAGFARMERIAEDIHWHNYGGIYAAQADGFPSFSYAIEGNPFRNFIAQVQEFTR